jgi:hypothetical protein
MLILATCKIILFQSHYVIIATTTKYCDVVLTLFNMFFITGPIEHLFLQVTVQIKGGCFIGRMSEVNHLHKGSNAKVLESENFSFTASTFIDMITGPLEHAHRCPHLHNGRKKKCKVQNCMTSIGTKTTVILACTLPTSSSSKAKFKSKFDATVGAMNPHSSCIVHLDVSFF